MEPVRVRRGTEGRTGELPKQRMREVLPLLKRKAVEKKKRAVRTRVPKRPKTIECRGLS